MEFCWLSDLIFPQDICSETVILSLQNSVVFLMLADG